MGFEASKFGDGSATGSGNVTTQVHNHYGTRESERAQGLVKTVGVKKQLSIEITGTDVDAEAFPLLAPKFKAGTVIENVWVKTKEAFALTGTTPTILVGTEGSEVTNGFVVSETQAENTGTYDVTGTLTGTWAVPLAAATTIGLAIGGTDSPASTSAGKLEVIIEYTVIG